MTKEKLYPVYYGGKKYYEKDCDGAFASCYTCKEALNSEGGVYMAEGLWVYPNGYMDEY